MNCEEVISIWPETKAVRGRPSSVTEISIEDEVDRAPVGDKACCVSAGALDTVNWVEVPAFEFAVEEIVIFVTIPFLATAANKGRNGAIGTSSLPNTRENNCLSS